jgi:hypothetical protein
MKKYLLLALTSTIFLSDIAFSQREAPGGPGRRIWPPAQVPPQAQEHMPAEFPGDTHGGPGPRPRPRTADDRRTYEEPTQQAPVNGIPDGSLVPMAPADTK